MKNASTERALFHYAWLFRKQIFIGLICLILAVGLELTGPFIAKRLIDEHIVGIEGAWHQVAEQDDFTVSYHGNMYKRDDRLEHNEHVLDTVTIMQVGRDYYFLNEAASLSGERTFANGQVSITTAEQTSTFDAERLSMTELYGFFAPEKPAIYFWLGLYVVLLLIAGVFQYAHTFILKKSSNRIIRKMRDDVFAHLQRLPIDYFVNQPAGKVVARVTNDTEAIRELYVRVLATFVSSMFYMTGIFVALFLLDVRLALICLCVVPLIILWMKFYKHYGGKYQNVIRAKVTDMNGNINEAIQGMNIIQAFRQENQVSKEFEELNEEHFHYERKLIKLSALTSFNLVNVLRNIAFVAFLWYFGSASLGTEGIVTVGVLYAFVDYLNRLFQPVTEMVNQLPLLEQARVSARRVFELLDEEGEEVSRDEINRYKGEVAFHAVSFGYQEDDYVLKDIDFKVEPGQTAAFVGHTGSGKSTIMNVLFRFYDPQEGDITIDQNSILNWSRQQVRSHMGIVLQDPFIFSGTVVSNVTMNDPLISRERAVDALKAVGADRFIKQLPDTYDTPLKEKGESLSMGERQLISFARALAFDPAILILDEATSNIDTETESMIQTALGVLKQGRTTLVIAHRLSTIQQADQIFVLNHGTIVEKGNHEQLLAEEGLYYHMYQMQQGKWDVAAI
ncbi:ABC transporter ATP-binding protein [Thalassobacillus sp. CUG 92003]|uniref:ABC transporter ATP-binding protein n=1 Tax=Thalassobacillus sp. CUG 92003 TaxID=2736641 RepID=UPI0015E6F00E|nr:ABC transporter ATP-binding protein [Thalassobacillus sp. CUG 92003]